MHFGFPFSVPVKHTSKITHLHPMTHISYFSNRAPVSHPLKSHSLNVCTKTSASLVRSSVFTGWPVTLCVLQSCIQHTDVTQHSYRYTVNHYDILFACINWSKCYASGSLAASRAAVAKSCSQREVPWSSSLQGGPEHPNPVKKKTHIGNPQSVLPRWNQLTRIRWRGTNWGGQGLTWGWGEGTKAVKG